MLKTALFSKKLIDWYHVHKRDLPWRSSEDPYKIWLSEIILQQTRVAQGMSYYHAFVENYPVVSRLANAPEHDVLKLWQGLGYYSRARNLHFAAKQVLDEHRGKFPTAYGDILKLKGVGTYTAAAIASFAFNQPHAVVDGNVFRVLSRIYGIGIPIDSSAGKKHFEELAQQLLDRRNPRDHNQAIMEFGAIQCVPVNPRCEQCIFASDCVAFLTGKVKEYPEKSKKTKQTTRYFNYLVIERGDRTFIEKRTGDGIWRNLYQFPLIETPLPVTSSSLVKLSSWKEIFGNRKDVKTGKEFTEFKHILSHQVIYARFWKIELTGALTGFVEIHREDIENYPIPRLIDRFIHG